MDHFRQYLNAFEQQVLIYGFQEQVLAWNKLDPVPVRPGKLNPTKFGRFIGNTFECDQLLAFDYYGMVKLSTGITKVVEEHRDLFPGVKLIKAPLITFASIMKEQVLYLSPDLVQGFDAFKDHLVQLRWHS